MPRFWWTVHNLIAHPLLVCWPTAGRWLHTWSAERMGAQS
jgi:hypothetical protein